MPEIIDSHQHLYSVAEIDGLIDIMNTAAYDAIAIASLPALKPDGAAQNALMFLAKILHPDRVFGFGSLDYTGPGAFTGKADFAGQARTLIALGADGIKMLEGKPTMRKATGIPLDSPVYDGFYGYLEAEKVPVLFHVADPEEFWDEAAAPAFAKENGWLYTDGTFAPKEQLYEETERVLRKFPGLQVTFAHFFFLSADIGRAARFLDKWPNVRFDLTPGTEMYSNFEKDAASWSAFFARYAGRIVYGTDSVAYSAEGIDWGKALAKKIRRFLETDRGFNDGAKGLGLAGAVLEKIYAANFTGRIGTKPKKVDPAKFRGYVETRLNAVDGQTGAARKFREIGARLG